MREAVGTKSFRGSFNMTRARTNWRRTELRRRSWQHPAILFNATLVAVS